LHIGVGCALHTNTIARALVRRTHPIFYYLLLSFSGCGYRCSV